MKSAALFITLFSLCFFASCTYVQKIQDGKMAIERKQYDVGIDLLTKDYKKAKSRIEKGKIAYYLGEAYRETGQSTESIDWFKRAYDNQYGVDALREYAFALKRAEQYEEAQAAFKNLGIEIGSPYEYRKEIAACKIAIGWLEKPNPTFKIMPAEFNSKNADYAPTPYENNQIVITSDRSAAVGEETYNWTGNAFSDLFIIDLETQQTTPFDPILNSEFNEGTAVFNKGFTEVYFTRCFSGEKRADNYCKLMFSYRDGKTWVAPIVLNFVEDEVNYRQPALSDDGNFLFFSSNHPDGWGGYDLYISERIAEGWSEPKLLTRAINTTNGNEGFPYIDGDTLYFSSDAHTGMGGLDIYKTWQTTNGNWSPPQNLKPPINSGSDDFGFMIDKNAVAKNDVLAAGFFTSSRNAGNDDIFSYEKVIPPPAPKPIEPVEVVHKMVLEGYVLEKIYEDPTNPNSKILGRKPLADAKVSVNFNKKKLEFTTAEDGFFTFVLEENTDYNFFASRDKYLNAVENFSTRGIGKDVNNPTQTFEVELVLDKIFLNREITLENIYYDFDRWDIREDAKPTLQELSQTLELNSDLRIQLASHTDCRGPERYNQELSQKRAQSAVDYLISLGIAPERLQAIGYGEARPEADCICNRCSEEEHQQNRRTTFAIVD